MIPPVNTPRYPLVVFDFDGTLADSKAAIADLMNQALVASSLPRVPDALVFERIGLSLESIVEDLSGFPPGHKLYEAVIEDYRQLCYGGGLEDVPLFDGIKEVLETLHTHGARMAIATGKSKRGLVVHMDKLGISHYFEELGTSDRVANPKPHPEMMLLLLEKMGHPAEETVMIGDTSFDLLMGKAAGTHTIAVSYGTHSREELMRCEPDFMVDAPAGLLPLLLG